MTGARPNIYVVVMDCCRADAFARLVRESQAARDLQDSLQEFADFTETVATSPWTIPSHASILTGLFPWHHGAFGKRGDDRLSLLPSVPTLNDFLKERGYHSTLISANGMLGPEAGFGIDTAFDVAVVAGWWEKYFRIPMKVPSLAPNGTTDGEPLFRRIVGALRPLLGSHDDALLRFPELMWGASTLLTKTMSPGRDVGLPVSSWIEEAFQLHVDRTSAEEPGFFLINLADTHEPYFPDRYILPTKEFSAYRLAVARQDYISWFTGKWLPTPEELRILACLYEGSVNRAIHRLVRLIAIAKAAGRWDDSIFVVTSDHGQELGEEGLLFHMYRGDEATLRVPLLVRFPKGAHAGVRCRERASLVDIRPTIESQVDPNARATTDGCNLLRLLDESRHCIPMAYAEGVFIPRTRERLSSRLKTIVDREAIIAYVGDWRISHFPADGTFQAHDVKTDPLGARDRWVDVADANRDVAALLREAALLVAKAPGESETSGVDERLRSWGYE